MVTFHMIGPDEIPEFPPHAERLTQLQCSAEDQQFLARLSAYLAPSAPNEVLTRGNAGGAEAATYIALENLQAAASEVIGVLNTSGTDTSEARGAFTTLNEIYASVVASRQAFEEAQNLWWDRHGDQ